MNQENKSIMWINFLHIYQPPTQSLNIVKKVANESYELIIELLKKYPSLKLTLNISGSLIELLTEASLTHILEDIKKLSEEGRIELVGSAMYHPILPLIPISEVRRQIELNEIILNKTFGSAYKKQGFYLPEMAYNDTVADIIKEMGFKWIILDEIHAEKIETVDPTINYKIKNGLSVIFRNRLFSRHFPPQKIINDFNQINSEYLITATDGELYGHWHKDDRGYYEKIFTSKKIITQTVSKYLEILEKSETVTLLPTHWETTEKHIETNNLFHLWNDPENKIHESIWIFMKTAISIIEENKNDTNYNYARNHLDRGLASCTWWWASNQKLNPTLSTWHPDIIEIGLKEIIKSVRTLQNISPKLHIESEKMYTNIVFYIWEYHWTHYESKN